MESWKIAIPNFSSLLNPIREKVREERKSYTIYPDPNDILKALDLTPYNEVRVVIIGQDPYHNGAADGLAFSSKDPNFVPASLNNVFKQVALDFGVPMCGYTWEEYFPTSSLEAWAKRGILLLNTCLSVRAGEADSHSNVGWQSFTTEIIKATNRINRPVVYMLWGRKAQSFKSLLTNPKHLILESPHPSPLAQGFSGNQHFAKAVGFLTKHGAMNSVSLRKHFNFKTCHEEIDQMAKEKNWSDKFTSECKEAVDQSNFYLALDESIHLFTTNSKAL